MADAASPHRFGKYHVIEPVQTRSIDEVFKVKTVGIAGFEKIQLFHRILKPYAHDPRFSRAFRDEMRRAVSLNHRNVVQIFEFGTLDGELFFASEYHPGHTLVELLGAATRARETLSPALAFHVIGELASALDHAHRKHDMEGRELGVVHAGLCPPSVLVSAEGYVKLADFGLARASVGTRAGLRALRPGYAAPEVLAGQAEPASDVYSLAVLATELLQLPPGEPPSPLTRNLHMELGDGLGNALADALAAHPAQRPSAADLALLFSRAQRAADPGVGARALGRFMDRILPRPARPAGEEEGSFVMARNAIPGVPVAVEAEQDLPAMHELVLEERRRVVAVACRIEGGTPERRREGKRALADLAYKRGAVVQADEEDWVLACFGLEVASEDDVAQVMRFSLEATEALREAEPAAVSIHGGTVHVRIGARQGVMGRRRGKASGLLSDVFDEARELALAAPPWKTFLGGGPGRLASTHYVFRDHPPIRRRSRKLRVLELLGRRAAEEARRGRERASGPFFGRAAELGALTGAFAEAVRSNRRRWCAVVGDPGTGKTRLLAELDEQIAMHRPRVLTLAATPGGRDTPYALVGDTLHAMLNLPPARGEVAREHVSERLRKVLAENGVDREEADELLAATELALELRDGAAPNFEVSGDLRNRVVATLAVLRRLMRGGRPRLTVVEDWHWVDGASREVFETLWKQPAERFADVVLTARPDDAGRPLDFPAEVAPVVHLGDLPPCEQAAMIEDRLGHADPAAVAVVGRRAGGNPLFIEELCRAVAAEGTEDLPETARSVIAARVDRLPRGAKLVMQYASVAGNVFRARLLEEILGRGVYRALRYLEDAGLVCPVRRETVDPEVGEMTFRHGLIQEAVYDSLSPRARREAHLRIGEQSALRHEAGHTESPAAIARHLALGGDQDRASEYYLRAGRLALAAGDARAAAHGFTKAIASRATREKPGGGHAEREREALRGREQALFALGDHEAQLQDLRALERRAGNRPGDRADVQVRLATRHLRLGELAQAVEASRRAEQGARQAGKEHVLGEALRVRSEAYERMADFPAALDVCIDALEIFKRIGASAEETRALATMGRIHLMCSQFEEALVHYEPALRRVTESGDPQLERVIRHEVATAQMARGEYTEAFRNTLRALELSQRYGDRASEGDNLSMGGAILLQVGRYDEAREWLDTALAIHEETQSLYNRADTLVYAGLREALAGDPERAFQWLEEAMTTAEAIGARYVLAHAKNQMAYALLARGEDGDVQRADQEASEAARIAGEAALVTCEIQARSRSALARLEAGDAVGALAPSLQAIQLLDKVRYIEWSTEEILFTHYLVLRELGDRRARDFLGRANTGLEAKLSKLDDPEWRASFMEDVLVHRSIRDAFRNA